MRPVVNWRAYELSRRAGATQPQPNVPCGKAGPVLLEPPFSRKIRVLVFFFFFFNIKYFSYSVLAPIYKNTMGAKENTFSGWGGVPMSP